MQMMDTRICETLVLNEQIIKQHKNNTWGIMFPKRIEKIKQEKFRTEYYVGIS